MKRHRPLNLLNDILIVKLNEFTPTLSTSNIYYIFPKFFWLYVLINNNSILWIESVTFGKT